MPAAHCAVPVARSALSSSHSHPCSPPLPLLTVSCASHRAKLLAHEGANLGPKVLSFSTFPPTPAQPGEVLPNQGRGRRITVSPYAPLSC